MQHCLLASAFSDIRVRYRADPARYYSAVYRLRALAKLIKGQQLAPWCRVTKEGVAVQPAVLAAAATVQLTQTRRIPAGLFSASRNRVQREAQVGASY